jgi:hypothetical protein
MRQLLLKMIFSIFLFFQYESTYAQRFSENTPYNNSNLLFSEISQQIPLKLSETPIDSTRLIELFSPNKMQTNTNNNRKPQQWKNADIR